MTAIGATIRFRRERTLRSRAARGDAAAFAAAYERHHQALYRYCRSILRHEQDAQDALQSTMARAFAALQDEQRDFELRPWLFRIAHNEAVSILRARRETQELDEAAADGREVPDQVAEREDLRLLRMDLEDLPDRQRSALVLRELNGLGHTEIAQVLGVSPGAAKQAIFEARTALFRCQEGREMDCQDVRRTLSDGDGRVLRNRAVRAHLRSCAGCRSFRAELEARPQRLRMLAPPVPAGTAAALLAELLGSGGAVKLLACVAIAGGGATLASDLRGAREPARPEAASAAPARERPAAPAVRVVPVERSAPQPVSAKPRRSEHRSPRARHAKPRVERVKRHAGKRTTATLVVAERRPKSAATTRTTAAEQPPARAHGDRGRASAPGQVAKAPKAENPKRSAPQGKANGAGNGNVKGNAAKPVKTPKPGQAGQRAPAATAAPPAAAPEEKVPPGRLKKPADANGKG